MLGFHAVIGMARETEGPSTHTTRNNLSNHEGHSSFAMDMVVVGQVTSTEPQPGL